ncbi:MAG: FG-GAP-like repeat-containing protein [Nostoc sp. DedSLP05]|nr:FG-GAP-like repeat-containing protein [Nostoc sp. DedSLP05]
MATTKAIATKQTLVIIDAGIDDRQILELGILPTAKVAVLNKHIDGIDQISALCKNHATASIQIIAHGSPGSLQLGNSQLNLNNLHAYRQQLQQWLPTEILIYGCEVAATETGKTFIETLHQLTGANIAASAGKIGNAEQGGSWELEVKIGQIDSTLALQPEIREAYPKVLASFATASNFTVGTNPISITVEDFNGDGNLDLVTANSTSNNVSVLLGNGTGGFATASNFITGSRPFSVTVEDFNGDGNLDLAVANYNSNTTSVLLGNGTGGFDTATNFTVGTRPTSVTAADFDGDGNVDLAVANRTTNNVSVLLGNGTGDFGTASNFTVGSSPQSVTAADFNGDNNLDLVVVNRTSNKVSVLLGDGTGSFATATNFTVGTSPFEVKVADFNGDGNLDLAVANYSSNNVSVLLGNGAGSFGTATNFSAGSSPRSLVVGDFNSDGNLDLATANRNGNNVSVLLGNGTGGFGTASKFTVGNSPRSITVGDFNGDGKLDLAAANFLNNRVSVLLNTTPKITIASGTNPKEGGPDGSFTITLDTPAPAGGLVVKFNAIGSTATATTDYALVADTNITAVTTNTFIIAQGQTTATLKVTAVFDNVADPNETVIINLESSPDYILGANTTATLTIAEPIAPVVTATSTPLAYTENDAATAIDSGLTVTDADSTNLNSAIVSITSGFVAAEDILGFTAQNGISGSYSNGVLTLTGSATVAQYQTALRSITYQNTSDNPSTTSRTISFIVNDGSLNSTTTTRNINLTAVNDAPVVTATNTPLAYTENDPAKAIDSGLTATDIDSTNLNSATVSITSGFVAGQDILGFTAQNGISGSYSNGVLTLTGSATVAQYQTALRSVTYQNTSDNPSTTTRTISFIVNDGSLNSTTVTRDINLTAVNDAPVVTPTSTPLAYTENDAATAIDPDLTIADVDSTNLNGATVSITNGFVAAEDTLAFTDQNGITGSYSNGILTLTGSATIAQYQTALRSITYQNTSDNPSTTTRTISFIVNDGSLNSTTVTRDINLTAVNDAPVVTATNTPLAYTENDAAKAIDPDLTIADLDSSNLTSAIVSIIGFVAAEDTLAFTDQNGITGSYSNGVLTLTGSATVAQYQTALRSVTYENSSANPSAITRTISFVINDGISDSTAATRDIDFTAVDNIPVITATNIALDYTENDDATIIDSGINIADVDSSSLNSAIVSIIGFVAAEDSLAFTDQNGITGSYSNGVLTLTGTASIANYQTALRSVTYQNSSDNPSATTRTISFVVNDGTSDSTAATRDINVIPVNDAPVITATNTTLDYTENDDTTIIDSGITIADVDSSSLNSATVTISSGFVAAEDSLAFTDQNGITGSYSNGVLTLTGTASIADYQTALRSVTYQNSSDNPTTTRTISFVVNDGTSDSTAATQDINLIPVNDAPVITATNTTLDYTENDEAIVIDSDITIADVDSNNLSSATINVLDFVAAEDTLAFTDQNGISGSYGNGVLTLTGSATVAQYQTALRSVTYRNNSNKPSTRSINFVVNDGSLDSTVATRNISFNPVDEEIPSRLTNPDDDVFKISGEDIKVRLEIKLTGHTSKLMNELGLFIVDDAQGTINGIAPGADGYAAAALERSKVIFSAIANTPNGFDSNNLTTLLELTSGQYFRFLLFKDSTFDAVRNDPKSIGKLLFSDVSTQKITALGDDNYSVGWKDSFNNAATDFNALVVKIKQINQPLPLGTNLQSKSQGEMIDLRDVQQPVLAEFSVYREAAYNNYVGFYQVIDENGGIDTNGDGVADVLTGQAGYTQAAVRSRVGGIDLAVSDGGSATYSGTLQPGGIFVPFIIVDGTPDALLDNDRNNDPAVYFPFLGANSDGSDHIRLLGNNSFGFEDLVGGGDRDFNDLIVKVNLTQISV